MPLILILGLPGTGKTFLAKKLVNFLSGDPIYLSTDLIRKGVFNLSKHHYASFGKDIYSQEKRDLVYNALYLISDILLKKNLLVIVDGTFDSYMRRKPLYEVCKRLNQKLLIIKTVSSDETIQQRINERKNHGIDVSDADFEIYKEFKKRFETLNVDHLVINTEQEISLSLLEVKKALEAI